ncbi:MAG: ABC transporter permease [Acidobacteriota bacterium]
MIDGILSDLTSGFRVLRKRPGFTLIALITLATGIAASCAVFTVVESVLLRPLPYPEAGRLVIPRTRDKLTGNTYNITYPDFTTWKEEGVFEAVALRDPIRVDLTGDGEPARVRAMLVGDGYFTVVRKAALFGSTFLPEDHLPGAGPVLLLGEAFWRSRYGADPEALGRSARVNDVAHTIVGVVPDEAGAPDAIDVWVPRQPDPTDENLRDWDNHAFTAIARLKHGESLRSTNVVLDALAARTEEQYPALRAGETIIAQGHFRTMGIPLLKGRDFQPFDDENGAQVMIVNRRFVEQMFGKEEPLGRRVRSWRDENIYREIVGVVGNERYFGVGDSIRPCVYVPHSQNRWREMSLVVRTGGDPADLIPAVRAAVSKRDPELVLAEVATMDQALAANLAPARFLSTLLAIFAIIALTLSAVGIYSVLSYLASQRTREIGVRMALGANRSEIVRMLAGNSLPAIFTGILGGLAGALALGRLLRSLLFEVSPVEPFVLGAVCSIFAGVALFAVLVPAVRATAMPPVEALRIDSR